MQRQRARVRRDAVARRSARRIVAWVSVMAVVFCGAVFGVVTLNAMTAAQAVEARDLNHSISAHERQLNALLAEVASLEEPSRIRDAASELGLVKAPTTRFLTVERPLAADARFTEWFVPAGDSGTDTAQPATSSGPAVSPPRVTP